MVHKEEIFQNLKTAISQGTSFDEVKKQLGTYALTENEIEEISDSLRKIYFDKERKNGFWLVGIGTGILVISFLLTILLFHHNLSVDIFMYCSSIIGLGIAFWGCTKIL